MEMEMRLAALRERMQQLGLNACIVPSQDPHQSEYLAAHWNVRTWITGFTGSAGTAVVTLESAGLWTDSRYFLQAEQELAGSPITFYPQQVPGAPEHLDWLKSNLKSGDRVWIDGALLSQNGLESIVEVLAPMGIETVTEGDPASEAWAKVGGRPPLPLDPIFSLPGTLTGRSCKEKLSDIRKLMRTQGAEHLLLIALDDVAWTFNLRGSDVESNPVFYAYALVSQRDARLFIQSEKVPSEVAEKLASEGVTLADYAALQPALAELSGKLMADSSQFSLALKAVLGTDCSLHFAQTPATSLKARKNPVELANTRVAMEKDGVALLRTLRWLEENLHFGNVREHDVAVELQQQRARMGDYFCESFAAIVGHGPHAAIVHYRPKETDSSIITTDSILLIDSGGQYLQGTTDITRTLALGNAPEAAKLPYTLVLKGHIALATAQFPVGISGYSLDPLARQYLWQEGYNYGHGTGHGVGHFLCVHEGPQGVGVTYGMRTKVPLQPGMVTSNEPGYYETGQWGIRIENLILCVEGDQSRSGKFLRFETLSLFPIDHRLIVWERLTKAEVGWLRQYHLEVKSRLSPYLNSDELAWLEAECKPYL